MAITFKTGNILDDDVAALVNPVNCVGVMGAGLAKQFKKKYPDMFEEYVEACNSGTFKIGNVHAFAAADGHYILNFPTKYDWRDPSKVDYINDGLNTLYTALPNLGIRSIAIPPLGCGLGGLEWEVVKPMIVGWHDQLNEVWEFELNLYEPK